LSGAIPTLPQYAFMASCSVKSTGTSLTIIGFILSCKTKEYIFVLEYWFTATLFKSKPYLLFADPSTTSLASLNLKFCKRIIIKSFLGYLTLPLPSEEAEEKRDIWRKREIQRWSKPEIEAEGKIL
jgi:hypothetical protein